MKKIALSISILACFNVFADSNEVSVWQDFGQSAKKISSVLSESPLSDLSAKGAMKQRRLILDESLLKNQLSRSNISAKGAKSSASSSITSEISLPLPDGSMLRVIATPSNVLSAESTEAHPELKTWKVKGVDDPDISGVIDFTTNGFHGMLMMPDGDTIFIDPDKLQSGDVYNSFSKQENVSAFDVALNCGLHKDHDHQSHVSDPVLAIKTGAKVLPTSEFPDVSISQIKTYRLAMSATAEYTEEQGGTAGAFSTMMTSISRINPIFERDLGVKLELLDLPELIFTDGATDPYPEPNNPSELMFDNADHLQNRPDDYDIGHVVSHRTDISGGGSGVAFMGVTCLDQANTSRGLTNGIKAAGATTSTDPDTETFDLVLLAHELGHQLGANHTFNSTSSANCANGRSEDVAVEPGSGSSLMAYGGLCSSSDNLIENPRDDYFHFASISQVYKYTRSDWGSTCGSTAPGTAAPTANAGSDVKIPSRTPFLLDGTASGGTSSWDQIDSGNASAVDVDIVDAVNGGNAIIRHNIPTLEQDRYIPSLDNLFAGTSTKGEIVPTTTRELNFAYVVRDGGVKSDKKLINVTDTGSVFSVTSQATSAQTFTTNQSVEVTWNTAGTDSGDISCSNVDIQLIRKTGVKNMLLASTPNDGSQNVLVPNATPAMTEGRVFVGCSDNSFFNISSANITVEKGAITVDTTKPVITIQGTNPLSIEQGKTYSDEGAIALDDVDGVITVTASGGVNTNVVREYTINYSATDAAGNNAIATRTVNVTAKVIADTTAPVIKLNGASTVNHEQGTSYTDAGATASDAVDGTVSVSKSGTVDTDKVGTYTITYTAVDKAGNESKSTRTVEVTAQTTAAADTTAPVIKLNGQSIVNIVQGSNYADAGATATDGIDGSVSVSKSGTVNTSVVGIYTIRYTAVDAVGNTSSLTRSVNVTASPSEELDTKAPVISLVGSDTVTVERGSSYIEFGATAFDTVDGNVTVVTSGTVNADVVNTYTITYKATDAAGNSSTKIRSVEVTNAPDTAAPVIILTGNPEITLQIGQEFVDPGFAASDDRDGVTIVEITGLDEVDTSKAGEYIITYTSVDTAGNIITEQRTVVVTDDNGQAPDIANDLGDDSGSNGGGGGSFGYLLMPLMILLGLRRKPVPVRVKKD